MEKSAGKTILLVEDEALIALAEKKALERYGYAVLTTTSGEKAIDILRSNTAIDLILMDIDLGAGLDGTETAAMILEDHNLPIVFLSSHAEPEIVEKTEKITSYGYVVKNSNITVLDASIKMAFKLFKARETLIESESLYSNLMENSIDAVYLLSESGKVLNANQVAFTMIGYTRQELLSLTIDDIDPSYPSRQFVEFWNDKPEGSTILLESVHVHKDGHRISVEVNGIFFKLKGFKYLFGVARDLTERKHREAALRESEEKYRKLFNYSNDAIFVHEIDADGLPGNNVEVNEQACRMLGYSREELLKMSIRDIAPAGQVSTMREHAQALLAKKHLVFQTTDIRRDGVALPVEVSAFVYEEAGRHYVVSTVRDISRR
ncbi:MAG: PAS domain S-box protein [Clostridia bacterium]